MTKLPAKSIYFIRSAVADFNSGLIFTSIWVLYFNVMKLSLVDISLLYIVITFSNFVLEIPTGVLADRYSRRLSVLTGGLFIGIAFLAMGVFPIFGVVLLTGLIEALGDTCISGALQAWITDEVGEDQVGAVFLRGSQISIPANWAGVMLSILLAAWLNYQVPIILGGILWIALTLFLAFCMPEVNFHPNTTSPFVTGRSLFSPFKASLESYRNGLRLVKVSSILQTLFISILLGSAFADAFYKFSRAAILQDFVPPVVTLPLLGILKDNFWIGVLEVLQGLFCLVGAELIRRKVQLNRRSASARTLFVIYSLVAAALLVFVLTGRFGLALAAWVMVSGLQDLARPIMQTWLNQNIPSDIRATVLSISSQTGMLGTLGSSTGLGAFGDRFGVRSALGLSGVLLLPILLIYALNARTPPTQEKL